MTKKYALYPGYVNSKNDGERHYISARDLAHLYGVKLPECIIVMDSVNDAQASVQGLTKLYPNQNGDYRLPVLGES